MFFFNVALALLVTVVAPPRPVIIDKENSTGIAKYLKSPRDSHSPIQAYIIAQNEYDASLKTKPLAVGLHKRLETAMLKAAADAGVQRKEKPVPAKKAASPAAEPVKAERRRVPLQEVRDTRSNKMAWWSKAAADHPEWVREDPLTGHQVIVAPPGYLLESAREYMTSRFAEVDLD